MRAHSRPLLSVVILGLCASFTVAACGEDEALLPVAAGGGGGAPPAGEAGSGGPPWGGEQAGAGAANAGAAGTASSACGVARADDLSGGTWDDRFTLAGVSNHDGITPTVYDFVVEPDGSVLAAGRFAYHEGRSVTPVLRRSQNGKWQPLHETWTLEPPGDGFAAIASNGGGVLALATADSFGERDGEVWLDEDGEQQVIGSFRGQVRALAWFAGKLYVAGAFALDDVGIENAAVWDGDSWSELPSGPADGPVLELLVTEELLYFAGAFSAIGDVSSNVAAFDGASWSALPAVDGPAVYALARTEEGELYAGGVMSEFAAAGGVVQLVGDAWQLVGGGLGQFQSRGVVSDLSARDGVLDVAGCFSSAGGLAGTEGAVTAVGLARWNGSEWLSLNSGSAAASPWFQPGVCGDEGVGALWDMEYQRLAYASEQLFAGGSFAGIEGVQTQSLAVLDGDAWLAQGKSGLGVGGSIDRVVTGGAGCTLYGLGAFTHLGGELASGRVARFVDGAWQLLPDDLPRDAYCPAIDVAADGTLAVGCSIFPAVGDPRGAVLVLDGADALVELELDTTLPPIHSMKWSSGGELWIAGGDAAGFVATVHDGRVASLSDDFDGVVQLLDVREDDVLVAGMFSQIGDVSAARIARYQGGEWSALGHGLVGQPLAIARDGATTYASTYKDGESAYLLGAFDGESWSELAGGDTGLALEDFYSFNQILTVDGGLVLVGTAELEDQSGRGALLFKDGKFTPIGGGGVHAIGVSGVAVAKKALWIGGIIAEASHGSSLVSSIGIARLTW